MMSQYQGTYTAPLASEAQTSQRVAFLKRTYTTLFFAIVAFMALQVIFFKVGLSALLFSLVVKAGKIGWLGILLVFAVVATLSDSMAHKRSEGTQMFGISLYVVGEALIFAPLIFLAHTEFPKAIPSAAIVTLSVFGGLTGFVLITKKDFNFLRGILALGAVAAIGYIIVSALFGVSIGIMFPVLMVVLAAGYILYETSRVVREYHVDQHIGAATTLFACVALMFWYILQLFMESE